jgi:hypothetical protein
MVQAINQIHVQVAGQTEHDGVASGSAPGGVRSSVLGACIRLNLHDAAADHTVGGRVDQAGAEEIACDSR